MSFRGIRPAYLSGYPVARIHTCTTRHPESEPPYGLYHRRPLKYRAGRAAACRRPPRHLFLCSPRTGEPMGYCTAVLVTGATGLIGSDVVVRLVIRGRRPVLAVTHRNHTSRSATAAT